MNNYYFTADKWYGPLPEGILPQYVTPSLFSLIESLPSGDSLIPQFAGMVKEEGKDFFLRWGIDTSSYQGESCTYFDTEKEAMDKYYEWSKYDGNLQCMTKKPQLYAAPIKTAVPVADEFKYLNERAKNIPKETRLEVSKMMDKLDAEEGKQTFSERYYTYQKLFNYLRSELNHIALQSEMDEIIRIVKENHT